jgi:hypothetical protein
MAGQCINAGVRYRLLDKRGTVIREFANRSGVCNTEQILRLRFMAITVSNIFDVAVD